MDAMIFSAKGKMIYQNHRVRVVVESGKPKRVFLHHADGKWGRALNRHADKFIAEIVAELA